MGVWECHRSTQVDQIIGDQPSTPRPGRSAPSIKNLKVTLWLLGMGLGA